MVKIFCLPIAVIFIFIIPKNAFSSSNIAINELFPNPPGGTMEEKIGEWVELYNNGLEEVDVDGWTLCDAANHALTISSEYTNGSTLIQPKDFLQIHRNNSSFSLNNGEETVSLYNSTS